MQLPEGEALRRLEAVINEPKNELAEVYRHYSFRLDWNNFELRERIEVLMAPQQPLPMEETPLNQFLKSLNPNRELDDRPFSGGAGNAYYGRYWNDLQIAYLAATEGLAAEVQADWALHVRFRDQTIQARYDQEPTFVPPTIFQTRRLVVALLYPNIEIAQAVKDERPYKLSKEVVKIYDLKMNPEIDS